MATLEGSLANIPGLGGYLGAQQFGQEQQAGQMGILARLAAIQHLGLQNQLLRPQIQMQQQLASGGLDLSNPDVLDRIAIMSDKPGFGQLAEKKRLRQENAASIKTLQSTTDESGNQTGGALAGYYDSPYVGTESKSFQKLINNLPTDTNVPAAMLQQEIARIGAKHEAGQTAQQMKEFMLANRPPVAVTDATVKDSASSTGWSIVDARTGRKIGEAPQPATAVNPEAVDKTAQAIASGQIDPLSSWAMKTPQGMATMAKVMEINPDYSAQDYTASKKATTAFTSGKQGNTIRSFNVGLAHLDTLSQLADALGNNDVQAVNKIANAYAAQTGQTAPTNFLAAKAIVGQEIVKAIVGAGGGVGEREAAGQTLALANSPAQLKGVIDTYKNLFVGQISGLKQQWQASKSGFMRGVDDFDQKFLSPQVQAMVKSHSPQPAIGAGSPQSILDQADAILGKK